MTGCAHSQVSAGLPAYELGVRLALALALERSDFRPACSVCGAPDVVCCLECAHIACVQHADHGHALAVGLYSRDPGFLYCCKCKDIIVDPRFETLRRRQLRVLLGNVTTNMNGHATNGAIKDFVATNGVNGAHKINGTNGAQGSSKMPSFVAHTGLRGIFNLGATCYMAVILQSFVHNPLVRAFFLAGGHDSGHCDRPACLACCIDQLFAAFFGTPAVDGYGIIELLIATEQNKPNLSGSTEQDAHEFLTFLMDQLHLSHFDSPAFAKTVAPYAKPEGECDCVAHRVFAGTLRSTLACTCEFTATTSEPLMDLSLEVTGNSLQQCLEQFTMGERLSHYVCSGCHERGNTTKSLQVEHAPPVLQIQLKRFKHTAEGGVRKIESHVKFSKQLDLTPYTTHKSSRPYVYELFGVITHQGSLDTGHYTCMMKHQSGWYHFNDDMVTAIEPKAVLSTNAYLLFYSVKRVV